MRKPRMEEQIADREGPSGSGAANRRQEHKTEDTRQTFLRLLVPTVFYYCFITFCIFVPGTLLNQLQLLNRHFFLITLL